MKTKMQHGRTTLSALAGLTMVASMAAAPVALASETDASTSRPAGENEARTYGAPIENVQVTDTVVKGEFSYDQGAITPNALIKTLFQRATNALCGASVDLAVDNPLGWQLSVSGDVQSAFTASVGDLAKEESTNKVMSCTCGGNPVGGRATITADVKGIPVEHLLSRASVQPGANTVTFVSSDGAEVSFSLGYVLGHHAVLSYQINDEDLSASVGGNNQLWMTKTPANYFVRDIASIVVSTQEQPPADPGLSDAHPNSPNIGVLAGVQE